MRTDLEPFAMVPRDLIGNVSPRALQVWCCLAQWCDADERQTRPTIRRIAGELGVSRDAVERALSELQSNGRLVKNSGKAAGKGNIYHLRLIKRSLLDKLPKDDAPRQQGAADSRQGYRKNAVPYIDVVKEPLNQLTPLPPAKRGDVGVNFQDFWKLYPRREREAQARAAWDDLDSDEQQAALAAAAILAQVYQAASEDRRQYTPQAHKWIAQERWNDEAEAIEAAYDAPDAVAQARAEAKRNDPAHQAAEAARIAKIDADFRAARREENRKHDERRAQARKAKP